MILENNRSKRFYVSWVVGLVLAGVCVILVMYLVFGPTIPDPLKVIAGIGAGLVSSISGFQIKEYNACNRQITFFNLMRDELLAIERSPGPDDEEKRKRINDEVLKRI
jgi:hypothetical protein